MDGEPPRILQLEDEAVEARTVVNEIAARVADHKLNFSSFAILCRTNEQPRAFEMELRRAKLPYVLVGGMSFYDRKEVRDLLAYLKTLANPRDEVSLLRIVNNPPRGIGQAAVKGMMEKATGEGRPLWDVLGGTTLDAVVRFREMMECFRRCAELDPLVEVFRDLIHEIGYKRELARLYTDVSEQESRWAAVEEVVNAVGGYAKRAKQPTVAGFLQDIALTTSDQDRDKESKLDRNAVVLMTLHAAKGLEFREVYMVGMEEGTLPHARSVAADAAAIDEERRLCYVGVTRAQRRLTLTLALSRQKWGKPRPTVPSRFLYEITGQTKNPNYLAARQQRRPGRECESLRRRRPAVPRGRRKSGKSRRPSVLTGRRDDACRAEGPPVYPAKRTALVSRAKPAIIYSTIPSSGPTGQHFTDLFSHYKLISPAFSNDAGTRSNGLKSLASFRLYQTGCAMRSCSSTVPPGRQTRTISATACTLSCRRSIANRE